MAVLTLVGTAVAGVLLVVVVLALARSNDWRSEQLLEGSDRRNWLASVAESPVVWVIGFLALALGTTGIALAGVGGLGLSLPGGLVAAVAPFALILLAFLVGGTYTAVRERNVSPAGATLAAALVVASLLVVAIASRLLMGP
jgi:hypothetical protein